MSSFNKGDFHRTIFNIARARSPDIVEKEVNDFIGVPCFAISGVTFPPLRNYATPPKACLQINLSLFENLPYWEQKYGLRHECFHISIKENESKTLIRLRLKYDMSKIREFIVFQHEAAVDFKMIKNWQDDWIKIHVREKIVFIGNPSIAVLDIRKSRGRKEAMLFCIKNIVRYLLLQKLYDSISNNNKGLIKQNKKIGKKYLQSFSNALNVYSRNLPEPRNWFDEGDYFSEELYFQKIEKLLETLEESNA